MAANPEETEDAARWRGYIEEAIENNPQWSDADLLKDREGWHQRNGLTTLFPFPWGTDSIPVIQAEDEPESN